jgi:DNA polymerase-3 subunit gamma/tau
VPEAGERRALYLRWRPQTFAEVVGQEHVTRTLRNAVLSGKLAHAYLLCGPRGTGKTSLARILYRAANCLQTKDGEPCGECPTCVSAASGRALDLVEIDAASNRGIEDIRQLRERVAYAPAEGRYRVYIIDEAHELTGPAWDAFLKTLEEPPRHTIFVLATTEAHKVPPTIVSRCQRFDLRRISLADIRMQLERVALQEGIEIEPAALDGLARMARGGLRDALSLLDQMHAYAGERVDLAALRAMLGVVSVESLRSFLEAVETRNAPRALEHLTQTVAQGADLRQFIGQVVAYLRGLLLTRSGAGPALVGEFAPDDLEWFRQRAPNWTIERLLGLTSALADGSARLRDQVQLELHLELAVLAACQDIAGPLAGSTKAPPLAEAEAVPESLRALSARASEREPRREGPPEPTTAEPSLPRGELPPNAPRLPAATGPSLAVAHEPTDAAEQASEPPAEIEPAGGVDFSLDRVLEAWPLVMDQLRTSNGVVAAMLETARPVGANEREVRLAFGFAFHQRRMSDMKNRRVVEETLGELLGRTRRITCVFQAVPAPPIRSQEELASALDRLIAEDPVVKRAVDLWGRNLTIVE